MFMLFSFYHYRPALHLVGSFLHFLTVDIDITFQYHLVFLFIKLDAITYNASQFILPFFHILRPLLYIF